MNHFKASNVIKYTAIVLFVAMLLPHMLVLPVYSAGDIAVANNYKTVFDGGTGTKDDPFRIATAAQLVAFSDLFANAPTSGEKNINQVAYYFSGKYIVLTSNIDLSDYNHFTPIGYHSGALGWYDVQGNGYHGFRGNFDGCGFTISNVTICTSRIMRKKSDTFAFGLFGDVDTGAIIKNLNVDGITIKIDGAPEGVSDYNLQFSLGGLAGSLRGKLFNCSVANFKTEYTYADPKFSSNVLRAFGGLVGDMYSRYAAIYNCHVRDSHIVAVPQNTPTAANQQYHIGGITGRVRRTLNTNDYHTQNGMHIHNCAVVNTSFEVFAKNVNAAYTSFDLVCGGYKSDSNIGTTVNASVVAEKVTDNYVVGPVDVTFHGLDSALVDSAMGTVQSSTDTQTKVRINMKYGNDVSSFNQTIKNTADNIAADGGATHANLKQLSSALNANLTQDKINEWKSDDVRPTLAVSYAYDDMFQVTGFKDRTFQGEGDNHRLIFSPSLVLNRANGSIIGEHIFTASVTALNLNDEAVGAKHEWTIIIYNEDGVTVDKEYTAKLSDGATSPVTFSSGGNAYAMLLNHGSKLVLPPSERKRDIKVKVTVPGLSSPVNQDLIDWTADALYQDVPVYTPRASIITGERGDDNKNTYIALLSPATTSRHAYDTATSMPQPGDTLLKDSNGKICDATPYGDMTFTWSAYDKNGNEINLPDPTARPDYKASSVNLDDTTMYGYGTRLKCIITYNYIGYQLESNGQTAKGEGDKTFTQAFTATAELIVGNTFYVKQDGGDDNNAGTMDSPFATIERAYAAIAAAEQDAHLSADAEILDANRIILMGMYETRPSIYNDKEFHPETKQSLDGYPIYYGPAVPIEKMTNQGTEQQKDLKAKEYYTDLARVVLPELLQGGTTFFSQLNEDGSYNDSLQYMPKAGVSATFVGVDASSGLTIPMVGELGEHCMLLMADTAFENLTLNFVNAAGAATGRHLFVYCNGFDFTIGANVTIKGLADATIGAVHGILFDALEHGRNYNAVHITCTSRNAAPTVAAYATNPDGSYAYKEVVDDEKVEKRYYLDPDKLTSTITVLSSTVGRVIGGGRNGNTFMPDMYVIDGTSLMQPYISTNLFGTETKEESGRYSGNYLYRSNIVIGGNAQAALVVGGQTDGVAFVSSKITIKDDAFAHNVTGSSIGNSSVSVANFVYPLKLNETSQIRGILINNVVFANDFKGNVDITTEGNCTVTHLSGGSLGRNAISCANRGEKINITVNGGTIEKDIFGGGRASISGSYANEYDYLTGISYNSNVFSKDNGSTPDPRRFISINVTINGGIIKGDVFGGGKGFYDHLDYKFVNKLAGLVVGTTNVTINGGTIYGNVCGGGMGTTDYGDKAQYLAQVWGDTNVTITGGEFVRVLNTVEMPTPPAIFGAGLGNPAYENLAKVSTGEKIACGNLIFGSGKATVNITPKNGNNLVINKAVYGGSGNGTVTETEVNIGGANINGTIQSLFGFFGGGENDSSKVTGRAVVNYNTAFTPLVNSVNGKINAALFGGSYGGYVNKSVLNIYAPLTTSVYGGGYGENSVCEQAQINYIPSTAANSAEEYGIYGGAMAGRVGIATVNIGDNSHTPTLQGDVYGAGRGRTSVTTSAYVYYRGSHTTGEYNLFGGSREGTANNTYVEVLNGYTFGGSVYGGGVGGSDSDNPAKVTGTATVIVRCNAAVKGDVFGAGKEINSWVNETKLYISGTIGVAEQSSPNNLGGRVFGGGDLGHVGKDVDNVGSTNVYILPGATIYGYVFGGGNGYREPVDGRAVAVTVEGTVYGTTNVQILNAQLDLGGGVTYGCPNGDNILIYGNVYGGCNVAKLYSGNDNNPRAVVINIDSSLYGGSGTSDTAKISINGAVFAGGNASGSLSAMHASVKTTYGGATVNIKDAAAYDRVTLTGGVYGDGNLALITGDSTINIENYGSTVVEGTGLNPDGTTDYGRDLTTIQRAHTVNIINSCIELHGARDLVSAYQDETNYSINRVKNLNLKSDDGRHSQLSFNNVVNQLNNLNSNVPFVSSDRPASGAEDTRTSSNRICIANKTWLEIRDGEGFGHVSGLFMLDLMNAATGVGGGYVYADIPSYDNADFINPKISGGIVPNRFSYWYIKGDSYEFNVKVIGYLGLGNTTITESPAISAQNTPLTLERVEVVKKDGSYDSTLKNATIVISGIDEHEAMYPITLTFDADGNMTASIITADGTNKTLTPESNDWNQFLSALGEGKFPTLRFEVKLGEQTEPEYSNVKLTFKDSWSTGDTGQSEGRDYVFNLHIETIKPDAKQSLYSENGKNYAGSTQQRNEYIVRLTAISACTLQVTTTYIPSIYHNLNPVLEVKPNVTFKSPNYGNDETTTRTTFPKNARIIMIDSNNKDDVRYYYINLDEYIVEKNNGQEVASIPLTDFKPLDGGAPYRVLKGSHRIDETFVFIMDFLNYDVLTENADTTTPERMTESDFAMQLNYYYEVKKVQQSIGDGGQGEGSGSETTPSEATAEVEAPGDTSAPEIKSVFVQGAFNPLVIDFADDRATVTIDSKTEIEYADEAITVTVTYNDPYPYHREYYSMGGLALSVILASPKDGTGSIMDTGDATVYEFPTGTYITIGEGEDTRVYYSQNKGHTFNLPLEIKTTPHSGDPTGYYRDYVATLTFTIHPGPQGFDSTVFVKDDGTVDIPITCQVRPNATLNISKNLLDDSRIIASCEVTNVKKYQKVSMDAESPDRIIRNNDKTATITFNIKVTDCAFIESGEHHAPKGEFYIVYYRHSTTDSGPQWVNPHEQEEVIVGEYGEGVVHEGKITVPVRIPEATLGSIFSSYLVGVRFEYELPHDPDNPGYKRLDSVIVPLTFIFEP